MPTKKKETEVEKELPFEEGMLQLERIVRELEAGTMPLSDSLTAYERGIQLVRELGNRLDAVEQKMVMLMEDGSEKILSDKEN